MGYVVLYDVICSYIALFRVISYRENFYHARPLSPVNGRNERQHQTQLNIVFGLCVGHDSLFYKYSDAICTTLVAKDRVTGHNPVVPLYQLQSYYKRLMEEPVPVRRVSQKEESV